jgi:hypothetical protein
VGRLLQVGAAPAWGSLGARAWDTQVWLGSPEKLAADLGWRAATSVETGLRHTLGWLQADAGRLRSYQERVFRPATV